MKVLSEMSVHICLLEMYVNVEKETVVIIL